MRPLESVQSSWRKQGLFKKRGVGGEEVKVVSLAPGLAGCFRYTKHNAHIHKGYLNVVSKDI